MFEVQPFFEVVCEEVNSVIFTKESDANSE
jgi:hypothetical protein